MKTRQIIKKNIKVLLRSKISTLVLIVAPLLLIMIVGLSFNSSSYYLKIGTYSESYSELSYSFIQNLKNESFNIREFQTNESCIDSVREQEIQVCIIFPPNMQISNEQANVLKLYVDESKINLVYLVVSKLSDSLSEVSSEISKDLTNEIVTTLFSVKTKLETGKTSIAQIKGENAIISSNIEASGSSLGSLNLQASANTGSLGTYVSDIDKLQDDFYSESSSFIDDIIDLKEDIENNGPLNGNQSDSLDDLEDKVTELETAIKDSYNGTTKKLSGLTNAVNQAINDVISKLNTAASVNNDVISKLNDASARSSALNIKAESLEKNIDAMIKEINSVKVTDTENIVSPISTEINTVVKSSSLTYMFPTLIVILIMFIGLFLPSTLIIMEKNSRASFRIFTTPTKPYLFMYATYLTSLILVFLQIVIIFSVSQIYFGVNLFNSPLNLLISLFFVASFFILLGMLSGKLFNTEEMSMLFSVSTATVLLLTSGIIFPIESMPKEVLNLIEFNPVISSSAILKKALLFNAQPIKEQLLTLAVSCAILLFFILFKRKEKHDRKKIILANFIIDKKMIKKQKDMIEYLNSIPDDKFIELKEDNAFELWAVNVLKNKELSKKLKEAQNKEEVLKIIQ